MGCGASSPGDAGLPGPNDVQPRRRESSFDVVHGAILDLPHPPPPPDQPTNNPFAKSTFHPFCASNAIGIASSSLNMPDAARSTDSKFAPGAESSYSRSYMRDSARAVHAVTVNPSFVHPDPALRSDVPSDGVSRREDDLLQPSDIRVADFGGSSSPSEQSAGNGVICPEPTAHEWSAVLARKRALAEFHGHTADPDQHHTARLRVNIPSDVHATCAVWLREVDTIF